MRYHAGGVFFFKKKILFNVGYLVAGPGIIWVAWIKRGTKTLPKLDAYTWFAVPAKPGMECILYWL